MSGASRARIAYQPALDGVRALAVAAVLAFHGGVAGLPGGFLGVDAFFVLSGFLITSLLLAEHARTGRIDLRRVLGPAGAPAAARRCCWCSSSSLLVFRDLLPPAEVGALRGDALAALGYVANWRMIYRGGDYFAATGSPSPLQHTWSLGIEEQFYLLWPLLLVGLLALRRPGGRAARAAAVGSACARRCPARRGRLGARRRGAVRARTT